MTDENINETTSHSAPKDEKPLVTFALFTYNQEGYIAEAIQGALSQTYSPLEIIISDDCSTDRTWEIVQREVANYTGPHKLVLNRNETNLGIGAHVNRVNELAQGELIVLAAGDDISLPTRSLILAMKYIENSRTPAFIFSAVRTIDEYGNDIGIENNISIDEFTAESMARNFSSPPGCSSAISKSIVKNFPPINPGAHREDMVLAFRAALVGKILYIDEPLVKYRRHAKNLSKRHSKNANDIWALEKKLSPINVAVSENRLADFRYFENSSCLHDDLSKKIQAHLHYSHQVINFKAALLENKLTAALYSGMFVLLKGGYKVLIKTVLLIWFPGLYLFLLNKKSSKCH